MRFGIFLLLSLAAMTSGCQSVRYEYQAPASAEGKQCVVQCAAIREACRSNEYKRIQAEKRACERQTEPAYIVCLNAAQDKDQTRKCQDRRDKDNNRCSVSDNSSRCDREYDECFLYCGGIIKKVISRSAEIRDMSTTPGQNQKIKTAIRTTLATYGYRPAECTNGVTMIYCDNFSDGKAGISVWVNTDDPETVRMSYESIDGQDAPSGQLFQAIVSTIERTQK